MRERAVPVAFALLGVAVVAVTSTADAPTGTAQALFAPARPGGGAQPDGARPGGAQPGGSSSTPADTTTAPAPGSGAASTSVGAIEPDAASVEPASMTTALPDERARVAVRVAMAQIGLPYVWGGDGPDAGDRGFDCSGLTRFAYDEAGVDLPRTAHTQFRAGPRVPDGAPLQPGDLVFYGTYRKVHHVGMYIGNGRMVNAPTFGKPVQTAWYRWNGDDFIGASRPASSGEGVAPLPGVPEVPDPEIPAPPEFVAPKAPPAPDLPDPRVPQRPEPDSAALSRAGSDADIAAGRVPAPPPALVPPARPTPAPAGRTTVVPPSQSVAALGPTSTPGTPPGRSATAEGLPSATGPSSAARSTGPSAPPPTTGPSSGPGTPPPAGNGSPAVPVTPPAATPGTATPPPATTQGTTPKTTVPPRTTTPPTTTRPTPTPTPVPPRSAPNGQPPTPPTAAPTASPTTSPSATPDTAPAVTVAGRRVPLRVVAAGPDGLPTAPGIARGPKGWVVRLVEPIIAGPGAPVVLTTPDGRVLRLAVATRSASAPRSDARPADAPLTVLAPSTDGLWVVLAAR